MVFATTKIEASTTNIAWKVVAKGRIECEENPDWSATRFGDEFAKPQSNNIEINSEISEGDPFLLKPTNAVMRMVLHDRMPSKVKRSKSLYEKENIGLPK